jgi:disulfide bond formation protein DsbB
MSSARLEPVSLPSAIRPALGIALCSAITIAVVWSLERAGYAPCELCLKERLPFYAAVPLAGLVAWLARRGRGGLLPAGFLALALLFVAGAALGVYHSGVERKVWEGPSSCTGTLVQPHDVNDFLKELQTTQVVRCDAPALHVAGLSLAEWNIVVCVALAGVALYGFRLGDARPR